LIKTDYWIARFFRRTRLLLKRQETPLLILDNGVGHAVSSSLACNQAGALGRSGV
jgi:hypothetical protein